MSLAETPTGIAAEGLPHDGTSLGAAIRTGRIGAAEAMEAAIAAAERHADFGAVNWLDAEMGLALARKLGGRRAAGRDALDAMHFAGVPFLVKDLGSPFAGIPVHAGSAALARRLPAPPADSELAARFRRAGLVPFGRTSVPEFGLSLASEPAAFPPVRNPLDPSRTAGGSSGGAAAAVALGIVPLAHATDAGGSIRVPAACCGLVGLKPSRGAVPEGPDFRNHLAGLACELVVARSVRDVRASLRTVAGRTEGPMPDVAFAAPRHPLRLGLLEAPAGGAFDPDARGVAVLAAARHLETLGHSVEPLTATEFMELASQAWSVFDGIVSVNLACLFESSGIRDDEVEPLSAAVARRGRRMSGPRVFEITQLAVRVAHAAARLFRRFDAILAPMLAAAPPPLGSFPTSETAVENQWRRMERFAPTAALANAAGLPAVTVPFGADAAGLPLPVQILGPIGADPVLLDLAEALSRERPFAHRFPLAGHP